MPCFLNLCEFGAFFEVRWIVCVLYTCGMYVWDRIGFASPACGAYLVCIYACVHTCARGIWELRTERTRGKCGHEVHHVNRCSASRAKALQHNPAHESTKKQTHKHPTQIYKPTHNKPLKHILHKTRVRSPHPAQKPHKPSPPCSNLTHPPHIACLP